MAGFQYDGAQYDGAQWGTEPARQSYLRGGNYDASHWDDDAAQGRTWVIDNTPIRVTGVTLTPTTLSLEVRARDAAERALLATLDDDAGALETRTVADGTHEGLDTASGDNTFTVRPSRRLRPPRIERDWVVDDVSRDRTSADTQATLASLSFVARDTRAARKHTDAADSTAWSFDFEGGTIVSPRVSQISQAATTSFQLILTPRQAELFETVAAATAGAVVREVPDGSTYSEDTTPDDRQSVTITPPSGATDPAISQGEYVVTDWRVRGQGGAYRAEVEISSRFDV